MGVTIINPFVAAADVSLKGLITSAGLTSGLKLCLDAGDINSWPGSGLKWLDTAGSGYDFFKGTDGTTSAPTFSGTPGALTSSEYWALNGSQFFRYDSSNETWMDALHKDSAQWCALVVSYLGATGAQGWFGDSNFGSGNIGFTYGVNASTNDYFLFGPSGTPEKSAGSGPGTGAWTISAVSIDEPTGAGGAFNWRNGNYVQVGGSNTWDPTYSSPSSSTAANTLEIASCGAGGFPLKNGSRIAAVAVWQGVVISKANLDTLWTLLRTRWGL